MMELGAGLACMADEATSAYARLVSLVRSSKSSRQALRSEGEAAGKLM